MEEKALISAGDGPAETEGDLFSCMQKGHLVYGWPVLERDTQTPHAQTQRQTGRGREREAERRTKGFCCGRCRVLPLRRGPVGVSGPLFQQVSDSAPSADFFFFPLSGTNVIAVPQPPTAPEGSESERF